MPSDSIFRLPMALIAELKIAWQIGLLKLKVLSNSQIVVRKILGEYKTKEEKMQKKYLSRVQQLAEKYNSFRFQRISQSQNKWVDALSRLVSTSFHILNKSILVEILPESSFNYQLVYITSSPNIWIDQLLSYLSQGTLPNERVHAQKIQRKALRYAIQDGKLYN